MTVGWRIWKVKCITPLDYDLFVSPSSAKRRPKVEKFRSTKRVGAGRRDRAKTQKERRKRMNDLLLKAVGVSYNVYLSHGARSSAKLSSLHGFFHDAVEAEVSRRLVGHKVSVRSDRNGELTVKGALYPKRVDVAVEVDGGVVGAISLKFVVTNYKQNANNYFEHLLGETANLRSAQIEYGSFTILPMRPEYLSKAAGNKRGAVVKKEQLSRENVLKYINLQNMRTDPAFRPNPLGLLIVDLDRTSTKSSKLDVLGLSNGETETLEKLGNVNRFIDDFTKSIVERVVR